MDTNLVEIANLTMTGSAVEWEVPEDCEVLIFRFPNIAADVTLKKTSGASEVLTFKQGDELKIRDRIWANQKIYFTGTASDKVEILMRHDPPRSSS